MISLLSVTTTASDLALLTIEELRAAVGVTDTKSDAALKMLGARVASLITSNGCNVRSDGVNPPTLRKETLSETFRLGCETEYLILARRPIVSITSITHCDAALDTDEYEILAGAGMLRRLCNDYPAYWSAGKTVVVYEAGWATVPDDLKLQAALAVKLYWSRDQRDPMLKSLSVPGVVDETYWVGALDGMALPQDILDGLGRFMNPTA